jgi:glycosyltransferase involved in cell wall biosynthesis
MTIPDIVTDGETGFVVGAGDCPAIAQRAVRLVKDNNFAMIISDGASRMHALLLGDQ